MSYVTVMGGNIPQHAIIIWTNKETADQKRSVCYNESEVETEAKRHSDPASFRSKSHMHIFYTRDFPRNADGTANDSLFWQQVEEIRKSVLRGDICNQAS